MNQQDDFDRTLRAWFESDAAHDAPRHLFDAVVTETRARHPRLSWLAMLRADGIGTPARIASLLRPLVLLAIMTALLIGLTGGALLAGGSAQPLISDGPTSTPIVNMPSGFEPKLTPAAVEQGVLRLIAANQTGLAMAPIRVTKITLLPPGTIYPVVQLDGSQPGSFVYDTLSWAVDAEGTYVACGSTCSTWTMGTYIVDDASGADLGGGARGPTTPIPTESFRSYLAGYGQIFTPAAVPTKGVVDAKSVVESLQASGFPAKGALADPPIYGLVTCVDPAANCLKRGLVRPGQTLAIWWVGFSDTPASDHGLAWATVDAKTGEFINGDSPP